MSLIDTFKIDGNVASKYKENKSEKHPSIKKERTHVRTFKMREVVHVRLLSDISKMNKQVLGSILKYAEA